MRLSEIMCVAHNTCGINTSQQPSSLLPAIAPNFLWVLPYFQFLGVRGGAYDTSLSQLAHGILLASDWFSVLCPKPRSLE